MWKNGDQELKGAIDKILYMFKEYILFRLLSNPENKSGLHNVRITLDSEVDKNPNMRNKVRIRLKQAEGNKQKKKMGDSEESINKDSEESVNGQGDSDNSDSDDSYFLHDSCVKESLKWFDEQFIDVLEVLNDPIFWENTTKSSKRKTEQEEGIINHKVDLCIKNVNNYAKKFFHMYCYRSNLLDNGD